jgi:hypothetical protein
MDMMNVSEALVDPPGDLAVPQTIALWVRDSRTAVLAFTAGIAQWLLGTAAQIGKERLRLSGLQGGGCGRIGAIYLHVTTMVGTTREDVRVPDTGRRVRRLDACMSSEPS